MKNISRYPLPSRFLVDSPLGALVIRPIRFGGVLVRRVGGRLIRDGARKFESFIVTGWLSGDLGQLGLVGVGPRRATFFCDRKTTEVQNEILFAAIAAHQMAVGT